MFFHGHKHIDIGWPARIYLRQLSVETGCNLEELLEAMDDKDRWRGGERKRERARERESERERERESQGSLCLHCNLLMMMIQFIIFLLEKFLQNFNYHHHYQENYESIIVVYGRYMKILQFLWLSGQLNCKMKKMELCLVSLSLLPSSLLACLLSSAKTLLLSPFTQFCIMMCP